jgi:rSAM/selenodomain-associated transferase 1
MGELVRLQVDVPKKRAAGALVVMAKEPSAGSAKTRLCPPLTGQEAAALYRCFLLDTLEIMRQVEDVQPIIAYSPPEAKSLFRRMGPADFGVLPQVGADLSERLNNVIVHCLESGYGSVVVIGSDSPTLPLDYVRRAVRALADPATDMVLGPSDDGGYYLIGLRSPCAFLFQDIVMSTSTVAAETLERAMQNNLRVICLPHWYDVDRAEDLERLVGELRAQPDHSAQYTHAFLSSVLGCY